ncbi:hypothetical protein D9615_009205 [Tricholomella constricta]|uniref:Uncharacterized protein n=1 Tax=Tricholomella constricta TaxID=117010 RepID=A0A8H5H2N1_9AGAR|nr:hypothetical protein D9615_009205 [Tricholomella constricta]
MRASFSLYEHPELSNSDVWPLAKDPATAAAATRACVYTLLGAVSLVAAAGTFAAYHYNYVLFGRGALQDSAFFKQWL